VKSVVITVSNDLVTDQRVQRSISVLLDEGFQVNFVGRKLPASQDFDPKYEYHRFKLWFHKGFLFYAQLNIWLFFYLLFRKPYDLYWANDLDTLWPNYLVARLRRKPLIYDSHEYFCGVPEIQGRPLVKAVWQGLEKRIFPKLKWVLTVNNSIADLYEKDYGIRPRVLRNVGNSLLPENWKSRLELGLPENAFLMVNQGAGINVDRGMEEVLEALVGLDSNIYLMIIGKGDVLPFLKERAQKADLKGRVHFMDPMPYVDMLRYTVVADLGLSLDKDSNINYRFSLPNKVFDYIKCGIPILASKVVEVQNLVEGEGIGLCSDVEPKALQEKIREIQALGKAHFKEALADAAKKHSWEKEQQVIRELLVEIGLNQSVQAE
tara:strand:- start:562 stop:1695 length:1134 start_codon:yes stop_codon:yes gene_type:complete